MKESYDALSRDNKKKKVLYIVNDRLTVFCESTLLLYDIIQTRICTMFSRNKGKFSHIRERQIKILVPIQERLIPLIATGNRNSNQNTKPLYSISVTTDRLHDTSTSTTKVILFCVWNAKTKQEKKSVCCVILALLIQGFSAWHLTKLYGSVLRVGGREGGGRNPSSVMESTT